MSEACQSFLRYNREKNGICDKYLISFVFVYFE